MLFIMKNHIKNGPKSSKNRKGLIPKSHPRALGKNQNKHHKQKALLANTGLKPSF